MIVVWHITDRCNLACAFCAYDRSLPFERRDVEPELVKRVAELLSEYQKTSDDQILLSWIGGEPLLWKPFFPLSQWLHGTLGISVSTTTNGTTLHLPQVRAGILSSLSELTVSIDGLAEFHNAVRKWPQGWQRLETSIASLVRERKECGASLKLRANIVLMHDNLLQFEPLCETLAEWGFDEITFNQLGGRDRPEYFPAHRLTSSDARMLAEIVPPLQDRLALHGVRLCATRTYLDRIQASSDDVALAISDCDPGERFLFIDEHGRVAPCHFTADSLGISLDDINDATSLQRLPGTFSRAQKSACPAVCQDCPSTQVFAKFAS